MDSWWRLWLRFKLRIPGISAAALFTFVTLFALPGEALELHSGAGSVLKVHGDSTLHAYSIEVTSFQVTLKDSESGIWELHVDVDVQGMRSGKKLMDKNMFSALQAERFSKIRFHAQASPKQAGANLQTLTPLIFSGTLEVAGVSKEMRVTASLQKTSGGWTLQGDKEFEMTDFDVQPPAFMMGVLKTDKKIRAAFDIHLSPA